VQTHQPKPPNPKASESQDQSFDNHQPLASRPAVFSVSKVPRPMTPAESLCHQFSLRTQSSHFSEPSDDESTTASTETAPSKVSDGCMPTSSAKIREFAKVLKRQKETSQTKEVKNSERVSHPERQIHRLSDLEKKFNEVQTDYGMRFNLFESRISETVTAQISKSNYDDCEFREHHVGDYKLDYE
jgi:hypothetical protein